MCLSLSGIFDASALICPRAFFPVVVVVKIYLGPIELNNDFFGGASHWIHSDIRVGGDIIQVGHIIQVGCKLQNVRASQTKSDEIVQI